MKTFVRFVIGVAILAILASISCFQVDEREVAIVMRFGRPVGEVGPGLHFKLPTPIDTVLRIDRRIHVLDPDSSEYLTTDKKNIVIDSFVAWKVADAALFAKAVRGSVSEAETRLKDVLGSVILDVVNAHDFAALVSSTPGSVTLKEIGEQITARMQRDARKDFGIDVPLAVIKRVNFPGQNKDRIYGRMEADRKALAKGYRSEGEELYQKIKARTDRQSAELVAEAVRQAAEIKGQTDAEIQKMFAEAAAKDPELWNLLQQIELQESVIGANATIVLPLDSPLLKLLNAPPGK